MHLLFLETVYVLSEQSDMNGVEPRRVQEELSIDDEQTEFILEMLAQEGFVVWPAKGQVLMTAAGVDMVKQSPHEPAVGSRAFAESTTGGVFASKG